MSQSLPIELDALIFRGQLGAADDGEFAWEIAENVASGGLTEPQARALSGLLGVGPASFDVALQRARGADN